MKSKRRSRQQPLRDLWTEYRRNRLGVTGITILSAFVLMAVFCPTLTPYDPIKDNFLAEPYALPAWYTVLPQYRDYPTNQLYKFEPVLEETENWKATTRGPIQVHSDARQITMISKGSRETTMSSVELSHGIEYQWAPPLSFMIRLNYSISQLTNSAYKFDIALKTPSGKTHLVWSSGSFSTAVDHLTVDLHSNGIPFPLKAEMGLQWYSNAAEFIFSEKGTYKLLLIFNFQSQGDVNAETSSTIGLLSIRFPGRVFGVLGTDQVGSDLFSQLVYGSRISLIIGITSSLISVAIGLLVGISAAYFGGMVDEGSMRLVDVLLVLPGLPLLFIFSGLFGRHIWNLIFLIGMLSWPGFARVVRAQVLQLKTASFVEAARALGASSSRIILRHLIPNVLPLAYATVALAIPGAIITEAALSFLALGDPTTPSWGRMFYSANAFGAFRTLAWWWIIPPGVAITLLSLSFVFIGYALDEVLNPKLRSR